MYSSNAFHAPFPVSNNLTYRTEDEEQHGSNQYSSYWSIIKGLLYLPDWTRHHISYSASAIPVHMHATTKRHVSLVKHVLQYVAKTVTFVLKYRRSGQILSLLSIAVHVDADCVRCKNKCRSTTVYVITINGTTITERVRRRTIIELSGIGKDKTYSRKLHMEVDNKDLVARRLASINVMD